jgi:hypothetical protein
MAPTSRLVTARAEHVERIADWNTSRRCCDGRTHRSPALMQVVMDGSKK